MLCRRNGGVAERHVRKDEKQELDLDIFVPSFMHFIYAAAIIYYLLCDDMM
jgi:hypothetical protein